MKKYPYYFGYLVGSVITNVLIAFIPLFTLLIWYADLQLPNITMILLTMTILMFSLLSIGIIVSLSVILFKQVQALVSLLGVIMQFFTGAFIPINSLPQMLAPIAYLFPHTWAYELIRYYSFDGNWNLILPLELNWLLLVFFTVFYTIVALFLQKKVIKHAKQKGLHIL
jgi:ABC-type multidrug transport system permease subunit